METPGIGKKQLTNVMFTLPDMLQTDNTTGNINGSIVVCADTLTLNGICNTCI